MTALICLLAQCPVVSAKSVDARAIFPTGEFPADVVAVQAAVDEGGAILLKSTNETGTPTAFNFGPSDTTNSNGGVFLSRDVQISGEQVDGHWTTIDGGVVPFRGYGPGASQDMKIGIEGIDFEHPLLSAVIITAAAGADVSGNRISDVQGLSVCVDPPTCSFNYSEGRAIKFLGNNDPAHAITGNLTINNNVILNSNADLSSPIVLDEVAADVQIDSNQLGETQECGLLVINSSGHVSITGNAIAPGPGNGSPFSIGNGICSIDSEYRGASYNVSNNTLDIANPFADGIILIAYGSISGALVKSNRIDMQNTYYGGITLIDNVSGSLIANNKVTGSASFGLDILQALPGSLAVSNTFSGNNVERFQATIADLFLDGIAQDSILVGHVDTVVDLGVGNVVTGTTPPGAAAIGHQVSQAEALKRLMR